MTFLWENNIRNGQDVEGTGKAFLHDFKFCFQFLFGIYHPAIMSGKFCKNGRTTRYSCFKRQLKGSMSILNIIQKRTNFLLNVNCVTGSLVLYEKRCLKMVQMWQFGLKTRFQRISVFHRISVFAIAAVFMEIFPSFWSGKGLINVTFKIVMLCI